MSSAVVFWKWQMSCRAAVPARYRWGFTCLPCILASCIFLFCSSVQSNSWWPSMVLSLVFRARDVQHRQLSVDRRVHYSLLAWLLMGHHRFWQRLFTPGLLTFAGVVLVIISVSAPLLSPWFHLHCHHLYWDQRHHVHRPWSSS